MSKAPVNIVLCKSFSNNNETIDNYKSIFEKAGYNFEYLPTICFIFINQCELEKCLFKTDSYSGMILTSPRSVEAVDLILTKHPNILSQWRELPVYCVGPSTENLARKCLNLRSCFGSHCGNSENLAKFISTNLKCKDKPILYPCSEISRDTIENHLIENEYKIKKIISYKTIPCDTLQQDAERIFKLTPQIVVFFSPSVVDNLLIALGAKATIFKRIKTIAIGSITGQSLTNAGIVVNAISDKPDPESLLKAVQSIKLS
ncbi:uroporphyrinogen-III synthase [Leptopilina heterotoma]|uniref:uroporphyrinogen-III synthase n=1 Tax=Leptopilina heterotoma TaxID=63436 RepID=UPI001CA9A2DE|nr:uroporphyrinogen-III synthase [Leptopilina heterotoma]